MQANSKEFSGNFQVHSIPLVRVGSEGSGMLPCYLLPHGKLSSMMSTNAV